MADLTVEEKMSGAEDRARLLVAEKHFFDAAQPFSPGHFAFSRRNPYHWDVTAPSCPGRASAWRVAHPGGQTSDVDGATERAFRIRGEPGGVHVYDERWDPHRPHPRPTIEFRSMTAAMLWIAEELSQEY